MNELSSVGIILLLALLAGHIVKMLRVPEVTGYLLAGVALGPSLLNWISGENLAALEVLSQVALGLILFSIGTVFEIGQFQRHGRGVVIITVCESLCTFVVVTGALALTGQPWHVSLLLGIMAVETAAASTLMVLREMNAQGLLTSTLTTVFALDNLIALAGFSVIVALLESHGGGAGATVFGPAVKLVWQFAGGFSLGYVLGFLLAAWSSHVVEHGERLILLAGCVLLCVGVSNWMEVSPLVANLTIGATVVNYSGRSKRLYESLSKTDPPLYAIFFVLAGAELDVKRLATLGVVGVAYIAARLAGKFVGTRGGTVLARSDAKVRRWLPPSMFAQAGLAVGLSLTLTHRLPAIAPAVTTVVLSAVIIFEIVGPFAVRRSIIACDEAYEEEEEVRVPVEAA